MADYIPIHPGEVLLIDFMKPMGMSHDQLAAALCTSAQRAGEIVNGRHALTVDAAMRLASLFGTTPQFWLNLQHQYDLALSQEKGMGIE